jgi:hypothetical protein
MPESTSNHFYLGFEYLNLYVRKKTTNFYYLADSGAQDISASQIDFQRSDLLGLGFGYDQTLRSKIGSRFGMKYVDSIEGNNQNNTKKIRMLIPEISLTAVLNPNLLSYIGINYGLMYGFSRASRWKSDIGGQMGLQLQMSERCSLDAGYLILRSTYFESDYSVGGSLYQTQFETNIDGGFNLSVNYSF